MELKKELIAVVIGLIIVLNLVNIVIIVGTADRLIWQGITGKASAQGTASICIVRPPTITAISDRSATEGTSFTYQVETRFYGDNSSINYFDNTTMFNINSSGYISFTPSDDQAGTYAVQIIAQDSSSCLAINSSIDFNLSIAEGAATTTPPAETGASGGGGGGGGGGAAVKLEEKKVSFYLSDSSLRATVKTSQKAQKSIIITNDGTETLDVELHNIPDILELSPSSFSLAPGNNQVIEIIINPSQEAKPDVYVGKIEVSANSKKEYISIIIQVESEKVLFDGSVDLKEKDIYPGKTIEATISLSGLLPGTASLTYNIMNLEGETVYTEQENITIEEQVSFTKLFAVPDDLPPGNYILAIKIVSGESFATTTESFTLIRPTGIAGKAAEFATSPITSLALPLISVLALTIGILFYVAHLKRATAIKSTIGKIKLRMDKTEQVKPAKETEKDYSDLKRKLSLLKESYDNGYLSKETYLSSKNKIEGLLK